MPCFNKRCGYLFAKAAEMPYVDNRPGRLLRKKLVCSYTPSEFRSGLDAERHKRLEDAFHLGRQFYVDFKFFQECAYEEDYGGNLLSSLVLVQNLGCFYSGKCLGW